MLNMCYVIKYDYVLLNTFYVVNDDYVLRC